MAIHLFDDKGGQQYVDDEKTPGKHHDGGGLYLVIKPSGSKSWVLRYRRPDKGDYGEMGLGSAQNYTLDEVRERARLHRQQVNPKQQRDAEQRAREREQAKRVTVAGACADYVEALRKKEIRKKGSWRTRRQADSVTRRFFIPAIGDDFVDSIDGNDAVKIIEAILTSGKHGLADAVEQHGRAIFKRCAQQGRFPLDKQNPFSRKGPLGLLREEIERNPVQHYKDRGPTIAEAPMFFQRTLRPLESRNNKILSVAEAAFTTKIDRSEFIRAIHEGKLRGYRAPDAKATNPWSVDADEVYSLWEQKADVTKLRPDISAAQYRLQFQILMPARPEQVERMRWEHYDSDDRMWVVPPELHKIGFRTGTPLYLPLSGMAVAIINNMKRLQENDDYGIPSEFIFAHTRGKGRDGGNPIGEGDLNEVFHEVVDEVIKREGLVVYALRGMFCTWAYEQMRYHRDAIEMSLGHTPRVKDDGRRDKTREAYDGSQLIPARRQLMEDWASYLMSSAPMPSEVVVPSDRLTEMRRLKRA